MERPWQDLVLALPLAAATGGAAGFAIGNPLGSAISALALYAVAALLILRGIPGAHPHGGLGPADRVTLARLLVALPIGALLLSGVPAADNARWLIALLGTLALALDGLDGWVARRTGTATPFGARFDMELDAALLLVLSILAWRIGPVGPWVIGIGALRYLFVAAGHFEPRLTGDLPEDQLRRKTVCVLQGAALILAVAPLGMPGGQVALAALTFTALLWSFGVDIAWLLRTGAPSGKAYTSRSRDR